jgi:DNA-binding CsgD family transcriptional regulator
MGIESAATWSDRNGFGRLGHDGLLPPDARINPPRYSGPAPASGQSTGVQLSLSDLTAVLDWATCPVVITNEGAQPVYRNAAAIGRIDGKNDILALVGTGGTMEPRRDVQISRLSAAGLATYYMVVWKCSQDRVATRLAECKRLWTLTRRQHQVLELLVRGKDNRNIGAAIGCSGRTIELHVSGLLEKSGCTTRAELIAHFWEGTVL